MTPLLTRLALRRCYPVPVGADTIHARALTIGELRAAEQLADDIQAGFVLACALVNDAGEQEIPRLNLPGDKRETNADYATRATEAISDIPGDTLATITAAIRKLNTTPPVENLIKN